MKKSVVFILILTLLISTLCGCEAPEKTPLEQGKSYEVVIKDDYKVTIEVISQTAEYFEVAVTKEKTDGYFHIKTVLSVSCVKELDYLRNQLASTVYDTISPPSRGISGIFQQVL